MSKIVYIAHPLSGDISGNLEKVKNIIRDINLSQPDIVPFAHYFVDCHALDDTKPEERQRGISNDIALLKVGFINEMWLYGDRISEGMKHEIMLAYHLRIPVFSKSEGTKNWQDIYKNLPVKEIDLSYALNLISSKTKISIDQIISRTRKREVCEARQFYFRWGREHVKNENGKEVSYDLIGSFICRDHATVLHGIRTVNEVKELREKYEELFEGKIPVRKSDIDKELKDLLIGKNPSGAKVVNMVSPYSGIQSGIREYSGYREHAL